MEIKRICKEFAMCQIIKGNLKKILPYLPSLFGFTVSLKKTHT